MIKNLTDMHTHTDNSPDGNHSTMFLCESAVAKGLRAIAFTDHCEVDVYRQENYDRTVRHSFFEVAKAQHSYRGQLLVLQGIELAQPTYDSDTALKIINEQTYDIVIGSIHNLRGRQDFYFLENFTLQQARADYKEYLNELCLLAQWGNFDTMAHITYPLRYFYAKSQIDLQLSEFSSQLDELLAMLAEKELALEINTAGLRQPIGRLSPDFDIIKRFYELGGRLITIGSDAHYAEDLGAGILEARQAAVAAGFNSSFIFQHREPIEIPFE